MIKRVFSLKFVICLIVGGSQLYGGDFELRVARRAEHQAIYNEINLLGFDCSEERQQDVSFLMERISAASSDNNFKLKAPVRLVEVVWDSLWPEDHSDEHTRVFDDLRTASMFGLNFEDGEHLDPEEAVFYVARILLKDIFEACGN